jgi:site-specific DNA-cytosine methylase
MGGTVAQKFGSGGNNTPLVVGFKYHQGAGARGLGDEEGISPALCADGGHPPALMIEREDALIRRLTPLECERLQGFPDGWTDIGPWTDSKGKLHKESSDAARYKALGNSIALPSWMWVLSRLSLCTAAEPTMASLFDGIGGFPLIWEWLNGKGTCLWASEIEEFPIAVTKYHFGCQESRANIEGGNSSEQIY